MLQLTIFTKWNASVFQPRISCTIQTSPLEPFVPGKVCLSTQHTRFPRLCLVSSCQEWQLLSPNQQQGLCICSVILLQTGAGEGQGGSSLVESNSLDFRRKQQRFADVSSGAFLRSLTCHFMLQYSHCLGGLAFPALKQQMDQHHYQLHYPPVQLIWNTTQPISERSTTTTTQQ